MQNTEEKNPFAIDQSMADTDLSETETNEDAPTNKNSATNQKEK